MATLIRSQLLDEGSWKAPLTISHSHATGIAVAQLADCSVKFYDKRESEGISATYLPREDEIKPSTRNSFSSRGAEPLGALKKLKFNFSM